MQEIRKLRELREADKKTLAQLKDTRDRLKAEYDQRVFQLNETESALRQSIIVWDKLIQQLAGGIDAS